MKKSKQKLQLAALIGLLGLSALVGVAASIPSVHDRIRTTLFGESRTVLAKVEGDITGRGDHYVIIKVKAFDALNLEVYKSFPSENRTELVGKLPLPETHDGYFNFRGQATNLVLTDLDNDNILELVAPTFDENLIPRLNIYRFDKDLKVFTHANADEFDVK